MTDRYGDLLVPTDGSFAATNAAEAVSPIAQTADATVHLLYVAGLGRVTPSLRHEAGAALDRAGSAVLEDLREVVEAAGLEVETTIVETADPVHEAIVDHAVETGIDLIAMGTRNPRGLRRVATGSVTRRVLRTAPQPVFTVDVEDRLVGDPDAIVLPTDGSSGAAAATDHALDLCEAFDAALHVIHVVDVSGPWATIESAHVLDAFEASGRDAVDEAVDRADDRHIPSVQASVLEGYPADEIVEYTADRGIDLVVMGTTGRTGVERVMLGSVAERVVSNADVPVLSVKEPRS